MNLVFAAFTNHCRIPQPQIRSFTNVTKCYSTTGWMLECIMIMNCLKKKEVLFICNRLLQIDLTMIKARIMKETDSTEIVPTSILEHSFYALGFPQVLLAHLCFYSLIYCPHPFCNLKWSAIQLTICSIIDK